MKAIYKILLSILFIGFIAGIYLYNSNMYLATYQSPSGNYELVIKNDRGLFEMTMPGDGGMGSMPVIVILKDKNGKIIGKSNDNDRCEIFYDSIDIQWDEDNERVWYGKSKTINTKTGKVGC